MNTKGMNPEQQEVFNQIVSNPTKNFFITGCAGTGKSYLLTKLIEYYKEKYSTDFDRRVGVTAMTGLAAKGINGRTLHSWAGLGLDGTSEPSPYVLARWRNCRHLIVDEVSMMGLKYFEAIFGPTPTLPDPASLYICKPSGVDPSVAPEGHENVFVLVPAPADLSFGRGDVDGDGDTPLEAYADRIIEQIADWANIPDLADRIVVRRTYGPGNFHEDLGAWRGTALGPAHILKQSAFFRAGNVSKKVGGLYFAGGSTMPGIGLPMCLISAELIVKRLRGDTSTGPLPEPLESTGPRAEEPSAA